MNPDRHYQGYLESFTNIAFESPDIYEVPTDTENIVSRQIVAARLIEMFHEGEFVGLIHRNNDTNQSDTEHLADRLALRLSEELLPSYRVIKLLDEPSVIHEVAVDSVEVEVSDEDEVEDTVINLTLGVFNPKSERVDTAKEYISAFISNDVINIDRHLAGGRYTRIISTVEDTLNGYRLPVNEYDEIVTELQDLLDTIG